MVAIISASLPRVTRWNSQTRRTGSQQSVKIFPRPKVRSGATRTKRSLSQVMRGCCGKKKPEFRDNSKRKEDWIRETFNCDCARVKCTAGVGAAGSTARLQVAPSFQSVLARIVDGLCWYSYLWSQPRRINNQPISLKRYNAAVPCYKGKENCGLVNKMDHRFPFSLISSINWKSHNITFNDVLRSQTLSPEWSSAENLINLVQRFRLINLPISPSWTIGGERKETMVNTKR